MKRGAKPPEAAPAPKAGGGGLKIKLKRRDSGAGAAGEQKGPGAAPDAPPVLDIKELELKRKETFEALRKCEVQIFKLESQYFDTANPQGNAIKGYEGLMSATQVSAKKAQFRPEDRIFSGSSVGQAGAGGQNA